VGFYSCDCTDFSCRYFPPSALYTPSAVIHLSPFLGGYCSTFSFLTTEEKHAVPIFLRGIPNIFLLRIDHCDFKIFVLSNILLPLTQHFNVLQERLNKLGETKGPWYSLQCTDLLCFLLDCCSSSALVLHRIPGKQRLFV